MIENERLDEKEEYKPWQSDEERDDRWSYGLESERVLKNGGESSFGSFSLFSTRGSFWLG